MKRRQSIVNFLENIVSRSYEQVVDFFHAELIRISFPRTLRSIIVHAVRLLKCSFIVAIQKEETRLAGPFSLFQKKNMKRQEKKAIVCSMVRKNARQHLLFHICYNSGWIIPHWHWHIMYWFFATCEYLVEPKDKIKLRLWNAAVNIFGKRCSLRLTRKERPGKASRYHCRVRLAWIRLDDHTSSRTPLVSPRTPSLQDTDRRRHSWLP